MHAQSTALPAEQGVSKRDQAEDEPIAYTVAKVARLLGKHPNTIYGWVEKGELPHQRIGGTIYIPKWAFAGLFAPAEHAWDVNGVCQIHGAYCSMAPAVPPESVQAAPPTGVRPHETGSPPQALPAVPADQAGWRLLQASRRAAVVLVPGLHPKDLAPGAPAPPRQPRRAGAVPRGGPCPPAPLPLATPTAYGW